MQKIGIKDPKVQVNFTYENVRGQETMLIIFNSENECRLLYLTLHNSHPHV